METRKNLPRWSSEVLRYLPLKAQFVITGNIRDQHATELVPDRTSLLPLVLNLGALLKEAGYIHFIRFDPVHGFSIPDIIQLDKKIEQQFFLENFKLSFSSEGLSAATVSRFFEQLECFARWSQDPIAIFADFSSRFVLRPDHLTENEHQSFTRALMLSHEANARPFGSKGVPFYNTVFWLTEKEGDLPDWFTVNNPRIRHVVVPKPDHILRRAIGASLLKGLKPGNEDIKVCLNQFVDATEGMLALDLVSIVQLCQAEGLDASSIEEGVRRFKLGVTEDPWRKIDRDKLRNAEGFVEDRVKGQSHAVTCVLDIVKRAVSGLSERRAGGGRPRGVAFLAGPTGVGKTELAKTITTLLFGDESAYIRFDMSEFSAEHSDQRLIGAPPGYVGYDSGGELTNAVRAKPFSVVLFDEIEKAHPRILDKFLQVLDDGVLTSGRGERVYFSETFIIFTSNLGIYRMGADGVRVLNVSPAESYESVAGKVRREIEDHFKVNLGRPEILNRIGENLIVFDFIRVDIAKRIFEGMVKMIVAQVQRTNGVTVKLTQNGTARLEEICLRDLSNGGRGIRNQLEAHFINPLARVLFEQDLPSEATVVVEDVLQDRVTRLVTSIQKAK